MNEDHFIDLLRAHGVHPTAQRIEIARLILDEPKHCSADRILDAIRAKGARVSKATVYNTLKLFCDQGLLRTVDVDPERQFYDSRTERHHHFFNVDTGELTDIPPEKVNLTVAASLPPGTEQASIEVLVRVRRQRVGV